MSNAPVFFIGIGCEPEQELPAEVLAFSIRQVTPDALIKNLYTVEKWAQQGEAKRHQRTPFSLQRFLLCHEFLRSEAQFGVYLDSDMLVLRPLEDLGAAFVKSGANIATCETLPEWRRRRQSSVLVFDREGAQRLWSSYEAFLRNEITYDDLIYLKTVGPVGNMPYSWNCLEYLDQTTALIHYTDMDRQPWLRAGNPNAGIWHTYLWRMIQTDSGRTVLDRALERMDVRPGLSEVVKRGPSESAESTRAASKDLAFLPPHRFSRLKSRRLRRSAAPMLRLLMSVQFMRADGQLNVR